MHLINDNIQKLFALCRKYKVRKLYAFGSILTPRFNDDSDVDILVDFNSEVGHDDYADNYFDFYYALKALFGRDVDLVDESAVKNPYFKEELEETKHLIYG
ncbi:MAG: nucleotidyltransferase domain-containing protein [Duncaniella sp.]|nr:nucleotidyltransferase domain-containing protein [Duncaniella sp.]